MRFFIVLFSALSMTSCVYHGGHITSSSISQPAKNCQYVDVAVGYSKVSYFLGIGGFSEDAFLNAAKRNLYFSYPINGGQTFDNITLDIKTTVIFPYVKKEAIVIADVVEGDTTAKITFSKNYQELMSKNSLSVQNGFALNENVQLYKENGKTSNGKVVKLSKNRITVFYINHKGRMQVGGRSYSDVFKVSNFAELKAGTNFAIGDSVIYTPSNSSKQFGPIQGTIIGLNNNGALIQTSNANKKAKYIELKAKK